MRDNINVYKENPGIFKIDQKVNENNHLLEFKTTEEEDKLLLEEQIENSSDYEDSELGPNPAYIEDPIEDTVTY